MAVTKLRMAILNDGRTQKRIAEAARLPTSRVSEYAIGRRAMTIQHCIALSRVLKLNPDELVGWDEDDEFADLFNEDETRRATA